MATIGLKANEENMHDDFDDFNFDDFNFDVPEPKDDRHPVMKTLKPMGRGAKEYITNPSNIERFVKAAVPKGYGQAYDLASEAGGALKQLYNSATEEIKPVKESAKKLLRKALPVLDGKIPKKLHDKLEDMTKEEAQFQSRQGGDDRENQLSSLLTSIFEQKATDEVRQQTEGNEREKIRQGFEQMRHRDQLGQLDAIRVGITSLVQYQNNVTFNVQKKQLELGYRQFWALAELNKEQKRSNAELLSELKATAKNTALPDFVKQTTHERFKELVRNKFLENAREGMFGGAKDYMNKFTRNLGDQVLGRLKGYTSTLRGAADGADMAADTMESMKDMPGFSARDEIIAQLMQLPMDWVAERGARKLNDITGKSSTLRRGSGKASHFVNTVGDRMHEQLNDPGNSWGRFEALREMLAGAAPSNTPESRMEVDNLNRMHEPKSFNRSNSKSLDEIIPGLLARIYREIRIFRTGDEKQDLITYDFAKNKFSTEKKLGSDLRQRIAGGNRDNANKYANKIIGRIDRSKTLTPEQLERTRKMLIEKSVMGESIDISKIASGENWGGGADGEAIAAAFNKYLKAKDGKLQGDNYRSRERQINLLHEHRNIVSGIGDPRVLLQQMVNSGQLENLKSIGIIDENNNLDRKVFAEWLMNAEVNGPPAPGTGPTPGNGPGPAPFIPPGLSLGPGVGPIPPGSNPTPNNGPIIPQTTGGKKKPGGNKKIVGPKPKIKASERIAEREAEARLRELIPRTDTAPNVNSGNSDEMLKELRTISEAIRGKSTPTASTVEKNVQTIVDLFTQFEGQQTQDAADKNDYMQQILDRLDDISKQRQGGRDTGDGGFDGGRFLDNIRNSKRYSSLAEHLKESGKEAFEKGKAHAKKMREQGGRLWDEYAPKAKSHAKTAWEFTTEKAGILKNKLKSTYGDVMVAGEKMPRLRMSLLKAGVYRDKLTGKVITSLEDINGDVVDAAGNLVITMEEFYDSYITGSINRQVKDVFSKVKGKLEDWKDRMSTYLPGAVQRLKTRALGGLEKLKQMLPPYDVYVKTDMTRPLMYANSMRYDMYVSKKTGKPIRHPREIDGPVLDDKGNIVVSEDHLKQGLVDASGDAVGNGLGRLITKGLRVAKQGWEMLRDGAIGLFGSIGKGLGNVGDSLKNFFTPFADMITNSTKTVTLLQQIHDMLDLRLPNRTKKKVRGDLDGDGIRDGSIEDIHLKRDKAKKEKQELDKANVGLASSNGMLGKLFSGLTGLFKKKKKDEDGDDEEGGGSMLEDALDAWDTVRGDGKDDSPEGKKRARRNEAKKRLKRMKAAARARAAGGAGGGAGGGGRMSRLMSRLSNSGLGNRARDIGTRINTRVPGTGGGIWDAAKWAGRKAKGAGSTLFGNGRVGRFVRGGFYNPSLVTGGLRGMWNGGAGALSMARSAAPLLGKAGLVGTALYGANELRQTMTDDTKSSTDKINSVGRTAAGIAGGLAGAKLGAAAGATAGSVVPLVGTAVGGFIGGILGGGLGYWGATSGGDKLKGLGAWWNKPKQSRLSTLRLAQYGVSVEDKEGMDTVFQLESTLEKHVTVKEDGNAYLNEKDVDLNEIGKMFGITTNQDLELFNRWYKIRFIPVYRKWLTVLRKIKPDGKLCDIETIIPAKDKMKIAEETVNSLSDAFSNMAGWNRAHARLPMGEPEIRQLLEGMRIELAKEVAIAGGEKAKVTAQSSAGSTTTDATALATKALTDKGMYVTKDKDGKLIDPNSMDFGTLTEKIKKGDVSVTVALAVPKNLLHTDKNQLDALTSIRYKAYGLTSLTADKSRMLGALESYLGDRMNSDVDNPSLPISTETALQVAGEVFGVPNASGEHATRWKQWFNGRFLPVFMLWAGTIRKKTNKSKIADASLAFPMLEQSSLARAIVGAQGMHPSGGKTSIWNITVNPWAEPYELNTNADTTAGNMEAIRLVADKVRLGEVTSKMGKVVETGTTNQETGLWADTKRTVNKWFGNDTGKGVRAAGDTVVAPKDSKPLAGMGDPVSFGNGGGNYTELPGSTGTGWSANRDLLLKAAAMSGVDPKALITTIAVESSFNPNAAPKNPNLPSSAKGFGQHLDGSWQEDLQRDGKKFGIPNGTNQFDARASVLMTASRLKFNGTQLAKSLGRPVTVTDLYLAHLMGLGGATNFLKQPEGAIGAEAAASAAKQHPEYFYKGGKALSVKEVYAGFAAKLAKRPAEFGVTDADMKSSGSSASVAATTPAQTASAPAQASASGATPVPQGSNALASAAAPQAAPAVQKASFNNVPSAGTPQLTAPIAMDKGKAAVMGTGVPMVVAKGASYELILQREDSEEDGTFGTLRFPDGTILNTLELPWKDNKSRVSSIPPGTYPCKMRSSANFGAAYEVQNVPGRSAILIHAGNAAGSSEKGMKADSQGCILLGMDRGRKGSQKVITASKAAMKLFHEKMGNQPFTLVVRPGKNTVATAGGEKTSVSFDPVRAPTVNATVAPKQEVVVQPANAPSFRPTAPRSSNNGGAAMATSSDLPRLNTTVTGFNMGPASKADMKGRDDAMTNVIAPRLEGMSKALDSIMNSTDDSAKSLRELVKIARGASGDKTDTTEKPSTGAATKVKPMTSTNVPVPQRRNV